MINAYAASEAGAALKPFTYDPGPLGPEDVELRVKTCGICHSDLSMLGNEWGISKYPFVPGHEVVGVVAAVGSRVTSLAPGQRVGLGWYSRSCMHCRECMGGDHNLCSQAEGVIVGRHGGFADRVRCHQSWAVRIPEEIDLASAGPLFCAGITVFNPIVQLGVRPTDRVGVIGIGGLGHLALRFLNAWGCEVTAFTSSPDKAAEAKRLGAHHTVNSRDSQELQVVAGTFDMILCTVNVAMDWTSYVNALRPRGRLHVVGAVLEPIPAPAFSLITGQKSVSGSPLGSPATIGRMLEFAARHKIAPMVEHFPLSKVNEALDRVRSGKARYRVVLDVAG